jgi:hypothetical protein
MDGDKSRVVTARLPSGAPVQVELAEPESSDGMASVGLRDLDLDKALGAVGAAGQGAGGPGAPAGPGDPGAAGHG